MQYGTALLRSPNPSPRPARVLSEPRNKFVMQNKHRCSSSDCSSQAGPGKARALGSRALGALLLHCTHHGIRRAVSNTEGTSCPWASSALHFTLFVPGYSVLKHSHGSVYSWAWHTSVTQVLHVSKRSRFISISGPTLLCHCNCFHSPLALFATETNNFLSFHTQEHSKYSTRVPGMFCRHTHTCTSTCTHTLWHLPTLHSVLLFS